MNKVELTYRIQNKMKAPSISLRLLPILLFFGGGAAATAEGELVHVMTSSRPLKSKQLVVVALPSIRRFHSKLPNYYNLQSSSLSSPSTILALRGGRGIGSSEASPSPSLSSGQATTTKSISQHQEQTVIPGLLRPWISAYRLIPKVYIPGTHLDISFTIASAILLTCLDYAIAHVVLYRLLGWPRPSSSSSSTTDPNNTQYKQTRAVAGSLTTIFHSTTLVPSLAVCLLHAYPRHHRPSAKLKDAPTWWQDAVHAMIQFCTGYMLYDTAIQFVADKWVPGAGPILSLSDWLFLGHHAATSLYMTSTRILQAGHVSAMILMCGGEFTAPFQNMYRIGRIAKELGMLKTTTTSSNHHHHHQYDVHNHLYACITYTWAVLYILFRILVGPACAIYLTHDLMFTRKGRANVPLGVSCVWLFMCWAVLIGSIPWIQHALEIIFVGVHQRGNME